MSDQSPRLKTESGKTSLPKRIVAGLAIAGTIGGGFAVLKEPIHDFVRPQSTIAPGVPGQIENFSIIHGKGFNGKFFSFYTRYQLGIEQCDADRQDVADDGVKNEPNHFDPRVGVVASGCAIDQVLVDPAAINNTINTGATITINGPDSPPLRKMR